MQPTSSGNPSFLAYNKWDLAYIKLIPSIHIVTKFSGFDHIFNIRLKSPRIPAKEGRELLSLTNFKKKDRFRVQPGNRLPISIPLHLPVVLQWILCTFARIEAADTIDISHPLYARSDQYFPEYFSLIFSPNRIAITSLRPQKHDQALIPQGPL